VKPKPPPKAPKGKRQRGSSLDEPLAEGEQQLFDALRALRRRLADEQGVPPYVVFGDVTLLEMSRRRPTSLAELLEITGVGQTKLERYGESFLAVLRHGS
jgi:ATP-dependent DNA helicase RecQ